MSITLSCGKENVIPRDPSLNGQVNPPPGPVVGGGSVTIPSTEQLAYIQQVKSRLQCNRMQDIVFHSVGTGPVSQSKTTIFGPFNNGPSPGSPIAAYAGVTGSTGHVLTAIKKVTNGVVSGYDIILSLCEVPFYTQSGPQPLISPQRQILGISIAQNQGIVLDDDVYCAINNVDAGVVIVNIGPHTYQSQFGVPITLPPQTINLNFGKICTQ